IHVADGAAANDLDVTGVISGIAAAGLLRQGAGSMTIETGTTQTYTGPTIVNQGDLIVDGTTNAARAVSVGLQGKLSGTGGVVGGTVSVASGGILSPGPVAAAGSGNQGILSTGSLTMTSGSIFRADVNGAAAGSGYDQLKVAGTVTLGGATLATNLVG